jgi:hypothetical protein
MRTAWPLMLRPESRRVVPLPDACPFRDKYPFPYYLRSVVVPYDPTYHEIRTVQMYRCIRA